MGGLGVSMSHVKTRWRCQREISDMGIVRSWAV